MTTALRKLLRDNGLTLVLVSMLLLSVCGLILAGPAVGAALSGGL